MKIHRFTVPSTGQKVAIKPLAAGIRRSLDMEQERFPKRPTYTITYPGGETEQVEHDPTTVETEIEKENWAAYVASYKAASREWEERVMKALVTLCLDIELPDGWQADYEYLGIDIPPDGRDQKVFYVNNVLLPTDEDKRAFSETVAVISTIRGEDLERIEAEFPNLLSWYSVEVTDNGRGLRLDDELEVSAGQGDGALGDIAQ